MFGCLDGLRLDCLGATGGGGEGDSCGFWVGLKVVDFVQGFSGGRIFGLLALEVGLVVRHGLLVFFVFSLLVYPEIECQIELVLSI